MANGGRELAKQIMTGLKKTNKKNDKDENEKRREIHFRRSRFEMCDKKRNAKEERLKMVGSFPKKNVHGLEN